MSLSLLQVNKKLENKTFMVVQNVILEVDKQHVFNTVTIATAHSGEEQSHTLKTRPLIHTQTHTHTHTNTHTSISYIVVLQNIQQIL